MASASEALFLARPRDKGPRAAGPTRSRRFAGLSVRKWTIRVDTSSRRVIRITHTWHRLNAGLPWHSGAEYQNSCWVSGNKPHPPREVGAFGLLPPVFICCAAVFVIALALRHQGNRAAVMRVRLARRLPRPEADGGDLLLVSYAHPCTFRASVEHVAPFQLQGENLCPLGE